ncbi:hypothetical protein Y88_1082 [Novosphingobium nitrogenifigens DSM 19370]|uniref:Uncharacterized protein n=1 Tax=Novosphingobium nitrogenifigens DSM 19370 TaxID=983920 RepID=F1Z8K5_9SPHN|nr:hypothetical protein Y88_1082 [Novosphingobium nitrogenifigens DSM 19370]
MPSSSIADDFAGEKSRMGLLIGHLSGALEASVHARAGPNADFGR